MTDFAGTAVLLMAHGTPDSLAEMPEYLRIVRGGRPPSPELIAEMTRNYEAIGGRSPLTRITEQQAEALRHVLGGSIPVVVGMRTWRPFIAEAVAALDAGITRLIGIPLAPQFSTLSVDKYIAAARAAVPLTMQLVCVRSFHDHPLLLDAFADRLRHAGPIGSDEDVIFTAHSLPERVVREGDPYPDQVAATAAAVADRCGLARYLIAYQSAGRTPEPWIGPDIADLIARRAAEGVRRFLVVPVGFVSDHTEILFDIDVHAAARARECGAVLRRTESLNTAPLFIRTLAALVREAVERHDGSMSTRAAMGPPSS